MRTLSRLARGAPGGLALVLVLSGCDADLERMIHQPSYRAYESNQHFEDGMTLREPPRGTVSRSKTLGPPELVDGVRDGQYVSRIPVPVDRRLLERGQNRFHVFCAACHGATGNGTSQVAENMTLRKPPSLIEPPISDYRPGRIYRVVKEGYGLMPAYSQELSTRDRWAVVAFLQALQLSQRVALGDLPSDVQEEARRWLP